MAIWWVNFNTNNLIEWNPEFDKSYIYKKYQTPLDNNYKKTLIHKNKIQCNKIKKLYNKNEVKKFFKKYKLNVPKLYYYSTNNINIKEFIKIPYVAKPAHMSESNNIFINNPNYELVISNLTKALDQSAKSNEPEMLKNTEKGIIIEEYIKTDYEFKVFVLYGCPILGDLRKGSKEWHRIDIIDKNNKYFNWDKEYEICKKIAKDLKIDFFRIDFLYNKETNKLYANEMAFRPSTLLGIEIEKFIFNKWKQFYKLTT